MIIFSVAVPADAPAWVLDWLRHSFAAVRAYLDNKDIEVIGDEIGADEYLKAVHSYKTEGGDERQEN